ncbi:hypothetical protein F5148DRAFT_936292 [Russula earlei]|uniref:Uncharacterized protein n=1 Tax=Russula earlei TaxID=71964 RepID=A0ACC0TT91_9AGAM|nr:hypothetical protein F5148DRAFT_936292 [Russula earlei]
MGCTSSVIQGRRPYRWTIWLYSLTRVATLMAVVMSMIGFDVTTPINCQLWIISELIFSYTAIAAASMLIVIRVIAIWNRNRVVSVIAMSTWATNIAALIRSIVLLRSVSSPVNDTGTCYLSNTLDSKLNLMTSLAADIVLLLIMLVGLLRWRLQEGGMPNIARFLWKQGLIWLLIATFSYVPTVVFISLNLNAAFNIMFQIPALVTLSIAATRMFFSTPKQSGFVLPETNRIRFAPISSTSNRLEVAVRTDCEQYAASQASRYSLHVITDDQLHKKPDGRGTEDDAESGVDK